MTRGRPLRLYLVDDHGIVRAGVRALLRANDRLTVVGEAETGDEALSQAPQLAPDVVLLDLSLPGRGGIETAEALRCTLPATRLVALSMHEDPEYVQRWFEAGGHGYVPKSSAERELVDAILAVVRGERYAPAGLLEQLARQTEQPERERPAPLTAREREVVRQIARGGTYREIAEALAISEKTVATYRERAAEKLGVRHRAGLVRWAMENGLVD